MNTYDPVCLIHGKKLSEHQCIYCCLCFRSLTIDECNLTEGGKREDVCVQCAEMEKQMNTKIKCNNCQGDGRLSNQGTYPPKRREYIRFWDCPECNGKGYTWADQTNKEKPSTPSSVKS